METFTPPDSKYRKVIMHKCPCINVLNIEMNLGRVKGITKPMKSSENWTNGDLSALRKQEMQIFHWFNFLNFLLVQFSPSPILASISMFKTFMCGDLSALKKTEMQIFHWFSFLNFPLGWLSPSPILGSISTFKTFMCGHLCVDIYAWTFMRGHLCVVNESPMCSFTLPDIFSFQSVFYV